MDRSLGRAVRGACIGVLSAVLTAMPAAAQKVWRHGIIEAKSDAGIFYMASKRDFAEKLGLKLEFVPMKTDTIELKATIAGDLDSFEGGPGGSIVAASRGADIKIIGCNWLVVPHGLFVRDGINAVADLKGKSIAVSAPGSFPELVARSVLEKANVPVGDVTFAAMGSDTDRYKALAAGVVDGAIVSNEYTPIAAKSGIKELVPGSEAVPNFVRVCLHATGKTLKERPDDTAKFLAAEMEGLRYAMRHRDETIRLTHEITGAKPDDPRAAFVYDWAVKADAIGTDLPIPMDKLAVVQKAAVTVGSMAKPVDLTTVVDTSVREKALALLAGH
ncbi:MAG TPA: ABC transporter substrate-binding protein [Xanthobacteraceae bacterium]|nr:ABC transporter substrate-binding protein [Xanthobacteraceae bacterium]